MGAILPTHLEKRNCEFRAMSDESRFAEAEARSYIRCAPKRSTHQTGREFLSIFALRNCLPISLHGQDRVSQPFHWIRVPQEGEE